jgi:Holliday junction resolvase RusA-like endonuclease
MTHRKLIADFRIPLPSSSKNARKARSLPNGRVIQFRPRHIVEQEQAIQVAALQSMQLLQTSCAEDDEIELVLTYLVAESLVHVEVFSLGPRPDGRTGRKRDVVNMPELVCDALQEVAYKNDRQISRLVAYRLV